MTTGFAGPGASAPVSSPSAPSLAAGGGIPSPGVDFGIPTPPGIQASADALQNLGPAEFTGPDQAKGFLSMALGMGGIGNNSNGGFMGQIQSMLGNLMPGGQGGPAGISPSSSLAGITSMLSNNPAQNTMASGPTAQEEETI